MGGWWGGLHNIVLTDQPFKRVSGDVTAFHRISNSAILFVLQANKFAKEMSIKFPRLAHVLIQTLHTWVIFTHLKLWLAVASSG